MGCSHENWHRDGQQSHEYYILQINGRIDSIYRCHEDAMRAGLPLKHQFPHADIKVRETSIEELNRSIVFH
jgi:hypothetical protein